MSDLRSIDGPDLRYVSVALPFLDHLLEVLLCGPDMVLAITDRLTTPATLPTRAGRSAPELDALEHHRSAEALLEQLLRKLARTTPPFTETLAPEQVTLIVHDDDLLDDEASPVIDMEDRHP